MKILAENRKAKFDYEIKETFVAGLVLSGAETKSVKNGNVSLIGSYAATNSEGLSLLNCHIGPYKYAPDEKYEPTRTRKLLLNKEEINKLQGKEKGTVIIPLEIFVSAKGWIKLKLGIGRARKKTDKREYIKKRDTDRDIKKALS